MDPITADVVEQHVQRVYALNDTYMKTIDVEPSQTLGSPASNADIERAQIKLNVVFPPSYRLFLTLHDGWKGWMGDIDLLSTAEMQRGRYVRKIAEFRKSMFEAGAVPPLVNPIIGVKLTGNSFVMFDRETRKPDGELDIVHWDFDEETRHESFLACLEAREKALAQVIREELEGQ